MKHSQDYRDNIELMFPDDVFIKGEELYEKGGVTEMLAIEKNLFSFIVNDKTKYEVEWLRPLTKHQKAGCECKEFKSTKICSHVVAALIAYKASLPEKTTEKKTKEVSSHLNLSVLLDRVSREELKSFVKTYAQGDKKLATALKVHFARKVDVQDNEKKYRTIMDGIIRPVTSGEQHFKSSDVKTLNHVASEFLDQAQDAVALQQYGEAFILCKTTLSKLCYTLHHAPNALPVLEKNIKVSHDILETIARKSTVHDNIQSVIAFLQELCHYSYYPYLDLSVNGLMTLLRIKQIPENVDEIITNQLWRKREDEAQVVVLLALQVVMQVVQNKPVTLDARYLHLVEKVGDALLQHAHYKEIDLLCQSMTQNNNKLALTHLKATAVYKPKQLSSLAARYFIQLKDLKLVDWLKQDQSAEVFARFRSEVDKKSQPIKVDPVFYTHYLQRSGQDTQLLEWMESQRDFRLLMMVDAHLFLLYPNQITDLYESMTEDYLNKHIGQHAYVFIEELMQHLHKIKAAKVAHKLSLLIELKFPHRSRMSDLV